MTIISVCTINIPNKKTADTMINSVKNTLRKSGILHLLFKNLVIGNKKYPARMDSERG